MDSTLDAGINWAKFASNTDKYGFTKEFNKIMGHINRRTRERLKDQVDADGRPLKPISTEKKLYKVGDWISVKNKQGKVMRDRGGMPIVRPIRNAAEAMRHNKGRINKTFAALYRPRKSKHIKTAKKLQQALTKKSHPGHIQLASRWDMTVGTRWKLSSRLDGDPARKIPKRDVYSPNQKDLEQIEMIMLEGWIRRVMKQK